MLNPKQHNIAHGPQGQRWDDGMIKADDRWANQAERSFGKGYMDDVAKTRAGESSHYYPGQGGPGTMTQGKLFHDPKPTDPVRWPRGYTPERMSDVGVTFSTGRGSPRRVDPIANKSREAIARSDMPERDLSALSGGFSGSKTVKIEELPPGNRGGGDFWNPETAAGHSWKGPGSEVGESGTIRLDKEASANTVLHEVGHAVSYRRRNHRQDAWGRQGRPNDPGVSGAEEARADMYANANARKRSGEPHQDLRDYDAESSYGLRGNDLNQFDSAYAREHMNQGVERPSEMGARLRSESEAASRAASMADIQATNHRANQLLFRRQGRDYDDPSPDYGQHPYSDFTGREDVASIRLGHGVPAPYRERKNPVTDRPGGVRFIGPAVP